MISIYVYAETWRCREPHDSGAHVTWWKTPVDLEKRHAKVRLHMDLAHAGAAYRLVKI